MHQLLDQAIAQMRADGMPEFPPGHPKVGVGKITRYGPKGRAWYRLEVVRTRAGTEVIVGAYGDWRSQLKAKIDVDWKGISAEERAELNARMRQQEEAEREKREERGRNAANRAKMQFRDSVSIEDARALGIVSAYLVRKGVEPEGCRFWRDGTVLVPVYALDRRTARAWSGSSASRPMARRNSMRAWSWRGPSRAWDRRRRWRADPGVRGLRDRALDPPGHAAQASRLCGISRGQSSARRAAPARALSEFAHRHLRRR
jgi:hypothetical protein